MSKTDDMALFVEIVNARGLAAAGRKIGLSPASMTARLNTLEKRYSTRLLHRTTRSIALTEAGQRFYCACLRVIEEVNAAEALLLNDKEELSGSIKVTAPSDFGRQYVAPALVRFARQHPQVQPCLYLTDAVVNLVELGYDLGIRFGNLPDSSLIVSNLASNRRVLVASPDYLAQHGTPCHPDDLLNHHCLVLERTGEILNNWSFVGPDGNKCTIAVPNSLTSNDGAVIRCWALQGMGVAFKSIWDVQQDLDKGKLVTLLDSSARGFQSGDTYTTGLQVVYPDRKYLPAQVAGFMQYFKQCLTSHSV